MHTKKRCSRAIVILAVLTLAIVRVAWAELFNDIWQFNKGSVEFNAINPTNPPPAPRHSHAATSTEDKMLVFFGIGAEGLLPDIWQYDPAINEWSELTAVGPSKPEPRSHHSAVALPNSESGDVFVLGGLNKDSQALADMFLLHTKFPLPLWSPLGKSPAGPRYGQSAVPLGNKIIIWGGHDGTRPRDDMWSFDPETEQMTPVDQGVTKSPITRFPMSSPRAARPSADPAWRIRESRCGRECRVRAR